MYAEQNKMNNIEKNIDLEQGAFYKISKEGSYIKVLSNKRFCFFLSINDILDVFFSGRKCQ